MRAFAEGYYRNLIRMYKYLGVRYSPKRFVYSFEESVGDGNSTEKSSRPYFVYSSNNHQFLPSRLDDKSLISWITEIFYVSICYFWWSICCFWIPPLPVTSSRLCESLEHYVQRIMLPNRFIVLYLLPLLSSVATCSHEALLQFPARDLIEYRRRSAGGDHYTVNSVREVQKTLGSGLDAKFSATVTEVKVLENGKLGVIWSRGDNVIQEATFNHVVLAVAPDIAGSIFRPLQRKVAQIPTAMVESILQGDGLQRAGSDNASAKTISSKGERPAEIIHLRTSINLAQTESIHVNASRAQVTTCPLNGLSPTQNVLTSVKFFRGLRTPRSRHIVNNLFGENLTTPLPDEKESTWRNGHDNVWLVGGWCWDGMVLLEGCVVSAMRVALALEVDVPWRPVET